MLFWKISLQLLAVGIALLVNRLDYVTHDKRTRKFKTGRRWLFILSTVFLAASIIVIVLDDREKSKEVREITGQLNRLKTGLENAQNSITGGSNFCHVVLEPSGSSEYSFLVTAVNKTDYPLYDISFRLWDPADYGKGETFKTIDEFNKYAFNSEVGNLPPHSVKTIGTLEIPTIDAKRFVVRIIARSGVFTEEFHLRKSNSSWTRAYRTFAGLEIITSKQLDEWADLGFPRNSDGKIKWE